MFSCVRAQPEAAAAAAPFAAAMTPGLGNATAAAIVSNAPAAGGPRVGFLADVRRMNVGLTRGRRAVWVVCHADTLAASSAWKPLLQEARSKGVLLEARAPFNRLLVASDKQLRGSYWTATAALAAADGPPPAATAAGGSGGNSGPAGSTSVAAAGAPAAKPRKPLSNSLAAAKTSGTSGAAASGAQAAGTAAADRDGTAVGAASNRRLQLAKAQAEAPPPPAAAATTALPAPSKAKAAPTRAPAVGASHAAGHRQGAADQPGGSSSDKDVAAAKLHEALQQRLQKQQQEKVQQQSQHQYQQQHVKGANRKPAGGEPSQAPADAKQVSGSDRALAVGSAITTSYGTNGVAATTAGLRKAGAGAPVKNSAASKPAAVTGAGSRLQGKQQSATAAAGGSSGGGSAKSGAGDDQDRLKEALLRRIQQQKLLKK